MQVSSEMAQSEAFYTFLVEWYDSQAALVRPFNMRYFLQDGQIDMFDLKSRKTFLKKCSYPAITLADLYPGAQVTVFARTLKVVDYADQITRSSLASKKQSMVLKLKNNSLGALADILTDLAKASLTVSALRRCIVNGQDMTVIQVLGEETPKYISAYKSAGGRSSEAKSSSSSSSWSSVEALEGKSATDLYNEVFKSTIDTPVVAATLARPGATSSLTTSSGSKTRPSTTAKLDGAITVAVVRPHAVQTGAAGPILDQLARVCIAVLMTPFTIYFSSHLMILPPIFLPHLDTPSFHLSGFFFSLSLFPYS